jgi:tetratricopeptide (TPR) repeat protein
MQSNIYQQHGRDHYKRGEFQKALECFDRAIGRAVSVQLLDNRAACNARLNDLPAALKDAKKAITLAREDPTGYLRAGKVLLSMDRKSVALEIYAHGLKSITHIGTGYEALRKAHGDLLSELAPAKSIDPFTLLPREIAINILNYLDFRDRTAIMRTSKQWRAFIRSEPNLWSHLDFSKARRKKVRTSFVSMAVNTAGRKIRQATITAKNYDVEKVLAALARQTGLEKLVLPDVGRFDQGCVDALKYARCLNHIIIGNEVEVTHSALQSFFDQFTPQLKHVELDLAINRGPGRRVPRLPTFDISGLLTLHLRALWALPEPLLEPLAAASFLQSLCICISEMDQNSGYHNKIDLRHCVNLRHLCLWYFHLRLKDIQLPPSIETLKLGTTGTGLTFADDPRIEGNRTPYRLNLPLLRELELDLRSWPLSYILNMLDQRQTDTADDIRTIVPLRRLTLHEPVYQATTRNVPWRAPFDRDMRENARLADLEYLAILAPSNLPDADLLDFFKCAPKLRSLDTGRSQISGIVIKQLVQMGRLKELRVGPSPELPRDAVEWARRQGVQVRVTPYMEARPGPGHVPTRAVFPF